jgi:hypothetical protein
MSYPLPLTIELTALPPNFSGSINDYDGTIEGRFTITAESPLSLINVSDVAPTSDEGPLALNGNQWQYWDDATGQYVDFVIPQTSLGWIASQTEPDENEYTIWIELDATNKPIAIKTHDGTSWVSTYYEKTDTYTQAEVEFKWDGTVLPRIGSACICRMRARCLRGVGPTVGEDL